MIKVKKKYYKNILGTPPSPSRMTYVSDLNLQYILVNKIINFIPQPEYHKYHNDQPAKEAIY